MPSRVAPADRGHESPPAVSLVLPVYNGAVYLAETIAAVRAQTFADLELIVVDDGSEDASIEVARSAIAGMRSARVVPMGRNSGKSGAVAAGLALARGGFVMEINADDVLEPDAVGRLVAGVSASDDLDCAFGDHVVIDGCGDIDLEATRRWSRSSGRAGLEAGRVPDVRRRQLASGIVPAGVCALIRTDAIGRWPAFTNTHTDYWLAWCAVRRGRVWFVGGPPLARYRQHSGNLTASFHERRKAWDRIRMDLAIARAVRRGERLPLVRRFVRHLRDVVLGVRGHALAREVGRSVGSCLRP